MKFGGIINRLEELLLAVSLAVMTLLTALQVVLRYGFDSGLIWSLEATSYAFSWLLVIGMSLCVRNGSHIATDLALKQLAALPRRIAEAVQHAICIAYAAMMLYGSVWLVIRLQQMGHMARDIELPRWLLTVVLPLGFSLLTWRLLQAALGFWRNAPGGERMSEQ